MKIKKVEIQAFRVYDKVENSTFNFMTELNEVADFISIHAPNGFGKTSFYDAVEWAFTNKITRYDRRKGFNSDLAKAERVNAIDDDGKRKHQQIIRNKFSDLEDGFVNLHTTLDDVPYSRMIPKVNKGIPDYKFEEQAVQKGTEHFHEVMLSQEWIDAFLKEDNAEVRYEKFVSSFGDVSLNIKYKAVIDLINLNKAKVKLLKGEFKGLSVDTEIEYDSNLLSITNKEIEEINSINGRFPLITPSFSEEDNYSFINLLKDKLEELNNELHQNEVTLGKLDSVKSGSTQEQIGLKSYYKLKDKLVQNELKLKELNELKVNFSERLDNQVKVNELKNNISSNIQQIVEFESIGNILPQYDVIENKIKNINLELSTVSLLRVEAASSLEDKKDKQKELKSELQIENTALNKLLTIKNSIPNLFKNIQEKNEKLLTLRVAISTDANLLQAKITDIETQKSIILEIENATKTIENDIYILDGNINFDTYKENISVIESQGQTLEHISNNIVNVNRKVDARDSLNNELKDLLDLGTKVISGSELSKCPLCQKNHESYGKLFEKVTKNPLLKGELKQLVAERSELQKSYDELSTLRKTKKDELLTQFNDLLKKEAVLLNSDESSLNSLSASTKSKQANEERLKLETEKLELSVNNLGKNEYITRISTEIYNQTEKFEKIKAFLKALNSDVDNGSEKLNLLEVQESNAKERIKLLSNESDFKKIKTFGKELPLSNEDSYLNTLKKLVKEKNQDVTELKAKVVKLNNEIDVLSKKLPSSDLTYYTSKIIEAEANIKAVLIELTTFEIFIKSTLNIECNLNELGIVELEKLFEENHDVCILKIKNIKILKAKVEKVERYKTNVIPFLKSEENRKNREVLEQEITFLDTDVHKELNIEKIKLSKFIDQRIESFFYKRLINSLYKKIDPHPRYNDISFECDFSQDKPKLNVFVSNNTDGDAIVPTLYFSTAQLNILSLSIFLAKALNTTDNEGKPIDCIFIDDPIQSMDSINILSTIDLFRSIVTNMGKQIILSTHDESFQNLLKKKMPEKLFKSKFIEFETFGKLKAS